MSKACPKLFLNIRLNYTLRVCRVGIHSVQNAVWQKPSIDHVGQCGTSLRLTFYCSYEGVCMLHLIYYNLW